MPFECVQCKSLKHCEEKITSAGDILVGYINRFQYDYVNYTKIKSVEKVIFEEEIQVNNDTYELSSIIIHEGEDAQGHYKAYVRDVLNEGVWWEEKKA